MSVALDQAIYALLTADTGTGGVNHSSTGATGGFHNPVAPENAGLPRVHFQELVTTAGYSFKNLSHDHVYYQFTVFAADTPTSEGVTMAGTLAERVRVLLTDPSMSVSGKTLLYCRFERTIPMPPEWDSISSRYIHAKGMIVELWLA